jgi:hypothetical protein
VTIPKLAYNHIIRLKFKNPNTYCDISDSLFPTITFRINHTYYDLLPKDYISKTDTIESSMGSTHADCVILLQPQNEHESIMLGAPFIKKHNVKFKFE